MNPINVLSLFDGMGGGMSALKKADIPVANYYASEIEKHPMKVANALHPEIIHLGCVKKIKVKSLSLLRAYAYIAEKYYANDLHYLQSILPEWEMLHRIEQEQTMATYFGTQIPNENTEIPPNSALQRNDRIWFFKRQMGGFDGIFDIIRGGSGRNSTDSINVGKLSERSFWWNGYRQFKSKGKRKSIERIAWKTSKRSNKTKNSRSCNKAARNTRSKRSSAAESIKAIQESYIQGKVFSWYEKGSSRKNRKTKRDSFKEERTHASKNGGKLSSKNDNATAIQNYRDRLQFYKEKQIHIIECEWGFVITNPINLVVFGSPCQGFSSAGEGLNFEDPRSRLLFDAVEILAAVRKRNPNVKFLLENVVPQKKEWAAGISQLMGIDPININSNLLSAQNRDRLYWTNIGLDYSNLFGIGVPGIKQPKDRGIVLRDVLEKEVDEKYYLSEAGMKRLLAGIDRKKYPYVPIFNYNEKSKTITTNPGKIRSSDNFIVETEDGEELPMEYLKVDKDGKVKLNQDKASTLAAAGNSGGNHSDVDLFIFQYGRGYNKGGEHHEKSPTLTQSWQNNNHVVQLNPSTESNGKQPYQQNRVYDIDFKSPCVDTGQVKNVLLDNFKVRRLTPREFGRLQTYSEEELDIILGCGVKDTNLFKMFGNGFTRDVIAYILGHLKNELP